MKKLTKTQIEKLRSVSVHQETYISLDDLQVLLETIEEAESERKAEVARPASVRGDSPKSS